MKRAATVALALGAVIGAGLSPASAQVIIGGAGEPDVLVNLSVLDRLGPVPTLADMLKADIPASSMRPAMAPMGARGEGITFRPYAETKKKAAKGGAPAVQPSPAVAELAEAAQAVKEARRAAVAPKPAAAPKPIEIARSEIVPAVPPKPDLPETVVKPTPAAASPAAGAGPRVSLPEAPAPVAAKAETTQPEPPKAVAAAPASAPAMAEPEPAKPGPVKLVAAARPVEPTKAEPAKAVEPAKVEPAKVEVAKVPDPAPVPAKIDPVAAPPAVAPAAAPAPQVAALPAAAPSVQTRGDTMSILFTGEVARLPDASRTELENLAKRLEKDESLGLQLLAYAEGDEASASRARRLSLSRALEVRKFLMEQGVRSTRIEVRALGNKSDGGAADRVDAILVAR